MQQHSSPATLNLYFSYWTPGGSLNGMVDEIEVSPHVKVKRLRVLLAQMVRTNLNPLTINETALRLHKISDDRPLPLKDLSTSQISLSDLGEPLTIDLSLASVFESPPAESHLHLVVVNLDNPFVIHCWVRGGYSDIALELRMPRDCMVIGVLSGAQERFARLHSTSLERLELYKFSHSKQEDIFEIVQGTGLGHLLPKYEILQTVFEDVPLNKKPCVVVEVVGLVDKRLPDWDIIERASKRPKVAPSYFGPSEYLAIQKDMDTRLIDGRTVIETPEGSPNDHLSLLDRMLPPFEVLYTGFGEFLDTYRAEREGQVGGSATLRYEVETFAEEMTGIYSEESSRQSNGLTRLNNIMCDSPHPVIVATAIDNAIANSHSVYGDHKIPCFFVEFKKEEASRTIPVVQLATYYQLSIAEVKQRCRELIYRSRFPALGMTVVGPVVRFYAMAWVGSVVYYPLTPGISCVSRATGGDDRRALHGAFIAARDLFARIRRDAEKLSETHPSRLLSHFYPDITELPSLDSSISTDFQITEVLQTSRGRILYRAKSRSSGPDLVIKITHSYSTDLHMFCANHGRAPMIQGFKKFPGNIVVVAMDYLKGDHLGQGGSQEFRDKMAEQLKQLVKDFHTAGYVHGDLRLPNIYCAEDEIKLLDFDWGGKVGEAFYPPQILNPMLSQGRDMDNLMITQEDDRRTLKMTLESIGCF